MKGERFKVKIQCKKCGEQYILRGIMNEHGHIQTGFRQCICNNKDAFNIETED